MLPCFCHAGDLFSLYTRDADWACRELDAIMRVGYHGLRTWTVLHGDYWTAKGREVNPVITLNYWDKWAAFREAVAERRLQLVVSQGDMLRWAPTQWSREDFLRTLAAYRGTVTAIVDAGNETWQNGEPDPRVLADLMAFYRANGGTGLLTLSSPPGEEVDDLTAWSQPPADIYDVHGSRAGYPIDIIRHAYNVGFEIMKGRNGIQSEPAGHGEYVSVTPHKEELDAEALSLMAVASLLSGQAWVYMSGEGVSIRKGLEIERGFYEVPAAVRALPRDLMTWGPMHHSGRSAKHWQGTRVFVLDDPTLRCDGRIADDGRFVYALYGPEGTHTIECERACEVSAYGESWTLDAGATITLAWRHGRVLQGRLR